MANSQGIHRIRCLKNFNHALPGKSKKKPGLMKQKLKTGPLGWALLFLLTVAVIAAVFILTPLGSKIWRLNHLLADMEEARNYFLSFQPYSTLYFIIFQILQVVISVIPGELTGFLGGFIFGAIPGFLYSMIGLTTGSAIAVTIGRIFKKVFLERIIPARILDMFGKRVGKWGLLTVFIFYLIPGAPKDYMCYLIGLSRIPLLRFIIVSSLGRMPATLVLSLEGGKVVEGDWVFSAVLAIASLVILIPLLVFSDRIQRYFGIKD